MDILSIVGGIGKKLPLGVEGKRRESLRKGAKRTIYLPSITAGEFLQYTPDHAKIRGLIRKYGYMNFFSVINNDSVNIQIELDYDRNKSYPVASSSVITVDEVEFLGFNVKNLNSSTNTTANKIIVIVGYEPPIMREREVMG